MAEEASTSALQQFCLLAKSAKGPACASLISQALEHPSVFVFGELLDMPNVQELAGTSSEPNLTLLKLFAYGTWKEYKEHASSLPELSAAQATKLKKLSIVSLSSNCKVLSYELLMRELEIGTMREVENLLIECIYGGMLKGKLDQQERALEVEGAIGRDVQPSELEGMCSTLTHWHENSINLLKCLTDKLEQYKQICTANQQEQADLDAKIAGIKTSLRTQQEGRAGGMGGSDFDASMDFDDDKLRKSGRTKGKLGF